MLFRRVLSLLLVTASIYSVFAQARVSPGNAQARILAVVPMIGAGTPDDPRRPAYTPLPPKPGEKPDFNGIIGFTFQLSDDGKHALVEFVARDRAAFKEIMADRRADVKVFEKGKARKEDIETEFRKYKKDVDLDKRGVSVR